MAGTVAEGTQAAAAQAGEADVLAPAHQGDALAVYRAAATHGERLEAAHVAGMLAQDWERDRGERRGIAE